MISAVLLSGDALRKDLKRGLANTDFDCEDVLTDLHHNAFTMSAVRTKLCLLFICFPVFSPLNLLIMHDK